MSITFGQSPERWATFVRRSPQRSAYVTSAFLRSLGLPFELVTVEDGDQIVAGAPLILGEDGRALPNAVPMTMYQGLLLGDHDRMARHRRIGYELEIVERLVAAIADRHDGCCLSQSWRFRDIRALSWHNYHAPERGQFTISVLYTGILDLSAYATFDEYLASVRELRRREHRKAKPRVTIEPSRDLDLLETLYTKTLQRQGIERLAHDRDLLRRIAQGALDGGYGDVRVALVDGAPAAATLFLYDDRTAFYLLGANDPEFRSTGASTFLMLENIRSAHDRGLREVDFIGVNSPQRGDYKVSFDAGVCPYYVARLRGPTRS